MDAVDRTGTATEVVGALPGLTTLVLLYEAIPEELVFRGYFQLILAPNGCGAPIGVHETDHGGR
ncbi:hypothetical protein [Nocardia wallacei]|uniref:Uncharacterized protein n=1 Tax=Nocardia wallacei TaxID=480035 RepID=A0A7G1KUF9_9NOCA|nr:hypothetical protein [Nocardia wallacei]BCK58905.1 hypothetical protein NWFMUON74_66770 [Nocardia wallacei]